MRHLLTPLLTMLALLIIACGSDEEGAGKPPTPTLEPTASPTPAPTVRPNSPASRGPSPTPVDYIPPTVPAGDEYQITDVSGLSPTEWTLKGFGSVKPLPTELEQNSEPLDTGTVIELWTELIGDTRLIVSSNLPHPTSGVVRPLGDFDLLFCSAGYGVVMDVPPTERATGVGVVFDWRIEHSPVNSWWRAILKFDVRDSDFAPRYSDGPSLGGSTETYHRPVFIVGDQFLIDAFTGTELEVSLLTMTDPDQFCSDTVPIDVRLF